MWKCDTTENLDFFVPAQCIGECLEVRLGQKQTLVYPAIYRNSCVQIITLPTKLVYIAAYSK